MEKLARDVIVNLIANLLAAAIIYLLGASLSVWAPNAALVNVSAASLSGVGYGVVQSVLGRHDEGGWLHFRFVVGLVLSFTFPLCLGWLLSAHDLSGIRGVVYGALITGFFIVTFYMGRQIRAERRSRAAEGAKAARRRPRLSSRRLTRAQKRSQFR